MVKLGDLVFEPVPESIKITGESKVVVHEIPFGDPVVQHLGNSANEFEITGIFRQNAWTYRQKIEDMRVRGESIPFQWDDFVTQVYISSTGWDTIRRGGFRYKIKLVEVKREGVDVCFVPQMATDITKAIAEAKSVRAQLLAEHSADPFGEIYAALTRLIIAMTEAVSLINEVSDWVHAPQTILDKVKDTASVIIEECDVIERFVLGMTVDAPMRYEGLYEEILKLIHSERDRYKELVNHIKSLPPTMKEYRVVAGDTLQSIAIKVYGTATRWQEIALANGIIDPAELEPGMVLKIP
ncbi:MAG: LysM peptidoglycan-binding domain-containing protein [Candidatus Korarchaeota archaeon]|nr:LysM peptidoglycan-binding domain-containing protein [Candidatus Korarchaeota archaeon]